MAPPAQGEPFLMYGVTPDHSNFTTDPGPVVDDLAWRLDLAGSRALFGWPLIFNGSVYLLESQGPFARPGTNNLIHRVERSTGNVTTWAVLDQTASNWLSDGRRIIIAAGEGILVYDVETATRTGTWAYPTRGMPGYSHSFCVMMTATDVALQVLCVTFAHRSDAVARSFSEIGRPSRDLFALSEGGVVAISFVSSYEIHSGALQWTWYPSTSSESGSAPNTWLSVGPTHHTSAIIPTGIASIGGHLSVTGLEVLGWRDPTTRSDIEGRCFLAILEEKSGRLLRRFTSVDPAYRDPSRADPTSCGLAGEPKGDPTRIFGKFQDVFSVNLRTLEYARIQPLADGPEETAAGAAYDGTHVYVTSFKKAYRFSGDLVPRGSYTIPASHRDAFVDFSPILTRDTLYVVAHDEDPQRWNVRGALYALDTRGEDLTLRWRVELPHAADSFYGFNFMPGLGESALVLHAMDGTVLAFGPGDAAPKPMARLSNAYPALGEPFSIDLSGTTAGTAGPPTAYRAEWGDGTSTEWQADPILTHSYESAARGATSYQVRLQAKNAQGLSQSVFVSVFAGASAPASDAVGAVAAAIGAGLGTAALLAVGALVVTGRLARNRGARAALLVQGSGRDRFEVVRELGRGATSVAQLARDVKLDRLVVLKQPLRRLASDAQARRRFIREARLAARVQHPHVLTLFEVLEDQDPPVLVLEYARDGSLEDHERRGPLRATEARRLVTELLEGLAAIHAAGIVHRDLKPANVLLANGHAKVADFGVALDAGPDAEQTLGWGQVQPGTIAYMSPEQLRGEPATPQSDQYAAAAIAYRLFTGVHHVDAADGSAEAVRKRILTGKINLKHPRIPDDLRAPLQRALALRPEARHADIPALLSELSKRTQRPEP